MRRAGRTSPPTGCTVVRQSAGTGEYSTFQAAVNSLSTTATGTQCIFIYQGTYNEQVYIAARTAQLTVYGYTTDTSTYTSNTVTITQGLSQDDVSSNDLTATLRAHNVGLKVYNINLKNTRGNGSQALAVSAQATQQGYYGVQFIGYQDTILANEGNQIYARCYIDGATDFIFGQRARAWFYKADIRIKGTGYITANGRDSESNVSYYVITDSDIQAAPGVTIAAGSTYLGRPWRNYSRVVFQRTSMSAVVNSAGWVQWNSGDPRTDNVYYREYLNTGTGSQGTRASFSSQLTAPETAANVLGSTYTTWADMSYLS
ncbi:pectinesterase-like protein [Tricharina praecox]|uniref:pectinesterase-like protein n=1 Tax=Tricharina praecox TaxID=43433 RepID=UPI00221F0830|nr:pectinesterase-like protein [Tricharina praecox]KAI5841673.1 pectinesterase-like protein [Tricharina praecox]